MERVGRVISVRSTSGAGPGEPPLTPPISEDHHHPGAGAKDDIRDILSSSYSRRTAIRPLNDIDVFVVLNPITHRDCYPPAAPASCLKKIRAALQAAYPNHEVRLQGRSVHIDFTGTGIGYDVVPAFEERAGGEYKIPDRDRDEWIRTNPEKHKAACIAANDRAGGKLNRLIKAAKRWNQRQPARAQLRSFHLGVGPNIDASMPQADNGLHRLVDELRAEIFGDDNSS